MIDLIISHRESKLDVKILQIINLFSGHFVIPISIDISVFVQLLIKRVIHYTNISSINIHNFIIEFRSSICDRNVTTINETLIYILDKYAHPKTRSVRKERAHWFNESTLSSKKMVSRPRMII